MTVFVRQRQNGTKHAEGTKMRDLPSIRHLPAMVGVQFPGEELVEWFTMDQLLTSPPPPVVPADIESPVQGELF